MQLLPHTIDYLEFAEKWPWRIVFYFITCLQYFHNGHNIGITLLYRVIINGQSLKMKAYANINVVVHASQSAYYTRATVGPMQPKIMVGVVVSLHGRNQTISIDEAQS